jgi:hypothetical protein
MPTQRSVYYSNDLLYVKKLWSLSPDKYKYIKLDEAIDSYRKYLYICGKKYKEFKPWLETEI